MVLQRRRSFSCGGSSGVGATSGPRAAAFVLMRRLFWSAALELVLEPRSLFSSGSVVENAENRQRALRSGEVSNEDLLLSYLRTLILQIGTLCISVICLDTRLALISFMFAFSTRLVFFWLFCFVETLIELYELTIRVQNIVLIPNLKS